MRIIETGKHKGKILADCPREYIEWAAKHEKNFAKRNRWISRDAKFLLARMAQVATVAEHETRKETELVVKIAAHLINTPAKVDLGLKGNLNTSRAFSLMR